MGLDKPVLIAGAGGQLGRALTRQIPDAVSLDRSSLSVTDREQVFETILATRPRIVFNVAAYTQVDKAEAEPERAYAVNAQGAGNLADACSEIDALLVQVSTDYVFDGQSTRAYVEDDETNPKSVYGMSKLEGEKQAARSKRHLIVRTSWVFGEGHNFIRSILSAAQTRPQLSIVDDQVGLPTYSEDLAGGLIGLVDRGGEGVFHLAGGGEPASWADLAELVFATEAVTAKVTRVMSRDYYSTVTGPVAPRPYNSVLDCSKADGLGVRLRPWREAVVSYLRGIA